MQFFTVALVLLMFVWAFFTAVQAKMNQFVKQLYREFYGKGEIYFGKTPGYNLTFPHVVAIVCCDMEGVILHFRCIIIRKVRGKPDILNLADVRGKGICTLNPSDYSNEKHILIALDNLIKNYQKYNPKVKKTT